MSDPKRAIIDTFVRRFRSDKEMMERAAAQISDAQLHLALDENTNSVIVIMKHASGNLVSRFNDFLTSDGEKPNRDRDSEFVDDIPDRASLMARWEKGWGVLFNTLSQLTDADLTRTITIRGETMTALDALVRALAHQAYHGGQIVQLCRHWAKDKWATLTVPRGGSKQLNEKMKQKFGDWDKPRK
jgi:uncharacterized damage-inducible protein DinB